MAKLYRITIRQVGGFVDFQKSYRDPLPSVLSRFRSFCISRLGDDIALDEIGPDNRPVPIAWQAHCPRTTRLGTPEAPKPFFYTDEALRLAEKTS